MLSLKNAEANLASAQFLIIKNIQLGLIRFALVFLAKNIISRLLFLFGKRMIT